MIIPLLKLIGGLALFLYGMDLASEGLQKFSAQKMRAILNLMTRSRLWALILGALVTLTLQSSSATSSLLVSFVNSSLVRLEQALALLLGANIGTTFTVQILAFNLTDLALLGVTLGFLVMKGFRSEQGRFLGLGLIGFGLVFYGMGLMSSSVLPLKDIAFIEKGLRWIGDSFLWGFLAAALFTALIHSSAAAIAFIMALASQGALDLHQILSMILGANVGTCTTALWASWGRGPNAWRLSLGHLSMKVVGVGLFYPILPWFGKWVQDLTESLSGGDFSEARFVANAHTLFNVALSILLLPGTRFAAGAIRRIIPGPQRLEPFNFEKEGLGAVQKGVFQMAQRVGEMILSFLKVFRENDLKTLRKIIDADEEVDLLNSECTRYLTQKASGKLGTDATEREMKLLYGIDQLEHVGDLLSKDIAFLARKKIYKDLEFSIEGQAELEEFHQMVYNLFGQAFSAFARQDRALAQEVIKDCEEVKGFKRKMHLSHLERLRKGIKETVATSSIYLDLITDFERISDHTAGIAKGVLE